MSIKRGAGLEILKFKGICDIEGLFKTIYDWMIHQDYEVHETKYKHKVPDPRGAEDEITLKGWRRVNAYVKYWLEVDFHIWDMRTVDVVRNGIKKKLVTLRMKITFTSTVELDYSGRFGGSRFLQSLQDFYNKYIIRANIQNIWEDELYYRTLKLHRIIKEFLDMETKTNASEGRW
ncbi:MAG: hypothetical protein V1837_02210 [Candidatus Woesearchaeota archaeon]